MHISLTEQQEQWIQVLIQNGEYSSSSEVMRHAIRLLQEERQLKEVKLLALREVVLKGVNEIERGEFSDRSVDQIIAEAKQHRF